MRLFVAAFPTKEVIANLSAVMRLPVISRRGVRPVREENIHLTLLFLGEIERDRLSSVTEALWDASATSPQVSIGVGGVRTIPSHGPPRVLCASCDGGRELRDLHERIRRSLGDVELKGRIQPFRPHLTLGRYRRGTARRIESHELQSLRPGNFEAREISLVSSLLGPEGPQYQVVQEFRLGG